MSDTISLRNYIGQAINNIDNPNIMVTDGDLSKSTKISEFKEQHPSRFIECGISETSAMSIGYGLALEGKIPFVVNFCTFTVGSAWTQLRMICYANANVKIIGSHPGIDNGLDGASHHCCEDLALARVLPNLTVLDPSNKAQLFECVEIAANTPGPFYIRVPRAEVIDYKSKNKMEIGKVDEIYNQGDDFAIIFEGSSNVSSFEAFDLLSKKGLKGRLINISSIKPLDKDYLIDLCSKVQKIVSVENHSIIGGLFGALAECFLINNINAKLVPIGIRDTFTESATLNQLKIKYGLTSNDIVKNFYDNGENYG
ncbi:MAG: transketolase C-terminal domain-containing protein [Sphaerochaetaceae bacterium]|nr:transketolase C-terminal domain-containing protein [Sphaerochaetaceae bacterium]